MTRAVAVADPRGAVPRVSPPTALHSLLGSSITPRWQYIILFSVWSHYGGRGAHGDGGDVAGLNVAAAASPHRVITV